MVAWVVINRQQPRQSRKSRPIRALPLLARLFNIPTFKPSNEQTFPPPLALAPFPILGLPTRSSQRKSRLSFHALTWNQFCNPFVFKFMHGMGGVRVCVATTSRGHKLCVANHSFTICCGGHEQKPSTHTDSCTPSSTSGASDVSTCFLPILFLFTFLRTLLHFFALARNSTFLFSSDSTLFAKNHPGWGYILQDRSLSRFGVPPHPILTSLPPYFVTSRAALCAGGCWA